MSITEYFGKLRSMTDELAIVDGLVSPFDFITHLIFGLGQPYYLVVVYIKVNVLKMSMNEAYSILLIHEVRLKSAYSNVAKEATLNFVATLAHSGNNQNRS